MDVTLLAPTLTPRQVLDDPESVARIYDTQACAVLTDAAHYVSRTLTTPDPRVGRSGPVCPFARGAVQRDMITMAVLPLRAPNTASLHAAALSLKADFGSVGDGPLSFKESMRAVMILFPYLEVGAASMLVEAVQKELKPVMVREGLMIGEFYPGCALPGLNNADFRPADTTFACLAIRRMTTSDLPFLVDDSDFLESYMSRFGEEGIRRMDKPSPPPASGPPPGSRATAAAGLMAQSVEVA